MKQKTIFRDQFGCMSMGQFITGITITFIIVITKQPDFIPLALGLSVGGTAIESIIATLLKTVSKNIEISNISAKEYIEKKLEETESNE